MTIPPTYTCMYLKERPLILVNTSFCEHSNELLFRLIVISFLLTVKFPNYA